MKKIKHNLGILFCKKEYTPYMKMFMQQIIVPTFKPDQYGYLQADLFSSQIVTLFDASMPQIIKWMQWYYENKYEEIGAEHFKIDRSWIYWHGHTDHILTNWDGDNDSGFIYTDGEHVYIT